MNARAGRVSGLVGELFEVDEVDEGLEENCLRQMM